MEGEEDFFAEISKMMRSDSKFVFPELPKELKDWSPNSITKYGYYIEENRKNLKTDDDIKNFAMACMNIPPYAYMALLTIPVSVSPGAIFNLYKSASTIPMAPELLAGITLIAANATVLLGTKEQFFNALSEVLPTNIPGYAVPFLYLSVETGKPTDREFPLPSSLRLACIQLYYTALNKLMLGDADKAEDNLLHALSISSKCKETVPSILNYLGLAQFLNKKSFVVYKASVPDKLPVSQQVKDLYDIDLKDYRVNRLFAPWEFHIRQERARRIIFDVANTFSQFKLEELKSKCPCPDFDRVLGEALSDVNFMIDGEWIYFEEPTLSQHIERQIESIQKDLFPKLQI